MNWPWLELQIVVCPSALTETDAGMRLDIALVHRLCRVAPLDDDFGLGEPGLDIALGEADHLGTFDGLVGLGSTPT